MRVAYFTYWGNIGTKLLEWLATSTQDEIVAVISRPGKEGEAIKEIAFRHYLPLYQPPVNVNDPGFIETLGRLKPDLFVSMYFGRLFSPEMLSVPEMGCVNMHPTLLPKYRGQGPNVWPIVNGDTETGQTIHWLDEGIDTGDIIAQKAMPIQPNDTGGTLGEKLERLGTELFIETWPLIASGAAPHIKQDDSEATYSVAPKRKHARIDWGRTAEEIGNLCRAFTSGKGAWARVGGKRLTVWEAKPYRGKVGREGDEPGQVTGVAGGGVVVRTGEGFLLLTRTEVTQGGPDLLTYLGGCVGAVPVVLG